MRRRGPSQNLPPAPAKAPSGYQGPATWQSNSVGGYGYASKPAYFSSQPTFNPQGSYSGKVSNGYSGSAVAAAGLAGVVAGVGSYYMYSQYKNMFSCGRSYSCCWGCPNSCFNQPNAKCQVQRTGNAFRDDILKEAFYPQDKVPIAIVFRSVSSTDPRYKSQAICPPPNWSQSSNQSLPVSGSLWVTLTEMQEFTATSTVGAASKNSGALSYTSIFIAVVNLRCLMRWGSL